MQVADIKQTVPDRLPSCVEGCVGIYYHPKGLEIAVFEPDRKPFKQGLNAAIWFNLM